MISPPNPQESLMVLRSLLGKKVVSYHPVFARALRSVPAAVMLSQGFFWQENADFKDLTEFEGRPFFSKTAVDWYEATGVTDDQQVTARNVLNNSGIWHEKRAGAPARLYFHVDINALVSVIYGYLNSGIQVSVDNRSKNREYTRASSGKFRQPVSVNYGNTNRKESLESIREKGESDAHAGKQPSASSKTKKEKAPQVPAAPPALFANSPWADVKATAPDWRDSLQALCEDLPGDLDTAHYQSRCRDWSKTKGGTSADWITTASTFAHDDHRKQKLATLSSTTNHANGQSTPNNATSSMQGLVERAVARADRFRARRAAPEC